MIEDEALRGLLSVAHEAIRVALREGGVDAVPPNLRALGKLRRLDRSALVVLRRAVEGDERIRAALLEDVRAGERDGAIALSAVERLWLERPEGWEHAVTLLAERELEERRIERLAMEERATQRRLEAAEQQLERLRAEASRLGSDLEASRAASRRAELVATKAEAQLAAASQQLEQARAETRRVKAGAEEAERRASDVALALEAETELRRATEAALHAERGRLEAALRARVAAEEATLRDAIEWPDPGPVPRVEQRVPRREPIPIPGGRYGDDVEVARYLVAHPGAAVLIDGYNVAKTQWPEVDASSLRERLVDLVESMVRRNGARVHLVFDGDDHRVVGWSAGRRLVHVHYSEPGESADDMIRRLCRQFPEGQPVVVVTSDRELGSTVRQLGANVIGSRQFLDAVTR